MLSNRKEMYKQNDIKVVLANELPGITSEMMNTENVDSAYKCVHTLKGYTFAQVKGHNLKEAKSCFQVASKLHKSGDKTVKSAIENVFVYSFSYLPVANTAELKTIKGLIPQTLYALYMNQVMHQGV